MPMYSGYESAARVISCRQDVCLCARNCQLPSEQTMAVSPRTCVGSRGPRGSSDVWGVLLTPQNTPFPPFHPAHWLPASCSTLDKILWKASTHWHSHSDCISPRIYLKLFHLLAPGNEQIAVHSFKLPCLLFNVLFNSPIIMQVGFSPVFDKISSRCFLDCLLHSHDLLWDPHLFPGGLPTIKHLTAEYWQHAGGNWSVPRFWGDDLSRTTLPNAQRWKYSLQNGKTVKIECAGVGIATMTVVGFLDIYYCVIIAWTFFYLFATYSALPSLPWATCGN